MTAPQPPNGDGFGLVGPDRDGELGQTAPPRSRLNGVLLSAIGGLLVLATFVGIIAGLSALVHLLTGGSAPL